MSNVVIDPLSVPTDTNILQYDKTPFNQYLSGPANQVGPLVAENILDGLTNLTNLYDALSTITDKNKNNENVLSFNPITKRVYRIPKKNIVLKKGYHMPVLRELEKIQLVQYRARICGGTLKRIDDNLPFIGESLETLQTKNTVMLADLKRSLLTDPLKYVIDDDPTKTSIRNGLQTIIDSFDTMVWSTIGIPEVKTIEKTSSMLLSGKDNQFVYPLIGGAMDKHKNTKVRTKTSILNRLFRTILTHDTIKRENDLYRSTKIFDKFDSIFNTDKITYTDDMSQVTVKRMYHNVLYLLSSLSDIKLSLIDTDPMSTVKDSDLTNTYSCTTITYLLMMCLENLIVLKGSIEYIARYKTYDMNQIDETIDMNLIHNVFLDKKYSSSKTQFIGLNDAKIEKCLEHILKPVRNLIDYYHLMIGFDLERYSECIRRAQNDMAKNTFIDPQKNMTDFINDLISVSNQRYAEISAVIPSNILAKSKFEDISDIDATTIESNPVSVSSFCGFNTTIDFEDMIRTDSSFLMKLRPIIVSNILQLMDKAYLQSNESYLQSIPDTSVQPLSVPSIVIHQNDIRFEIEPIQSTETTFAQSVLCIDKSNKHIESTSVYRIASNFTGADLTRVSTMNLMTDGSFFYGIPLVRSFIDNMPTDRSTLNSSTQITTSVVYMLYKDTNDSRIKGTIVVITANGCYFYDTLFSVVAELALRRKIMIDELNHRAIVDIGIDCVDNNNSVYCKQRAEKIAKRYILSFDQITTMISTYVTDSIVRDLLIQCIDIQQSAPITVPITYRYATVSDKTFDRVPMNIIDNGEIICSYTTQKTKIEDQADKDDTERYTNPREMIMVHLTNTHITDADNSINFDNTLDKRCFFDIHREWIDNPVIIRRIDDNTISLDIKLERSKKYGLIFIYDDPMSHSSRVIATDTFDGLIHLDKKLSDPSSYQYVKLDISSLPVSYRSSDGSLKDTENLKVRLYKIKSGIIKQDGERDNLMNRDIKRYIIDSGYLTTSHYDIETTFGWRVSWIINKAHCDTMMYIKSYFDSFRLSDLYTNARYFENAFVKTTTIDDKVYIRPLIRTTVPYKIMKMKRLIEKLYEKDIINILSPLSSAGKFHSNTAIAKVFVALFSWIFVPGTSAWYYFKFIMQMLIGGIGLIFVPVILFIMNVLIVCIVNPMVGDTSNISISSKYKSYSLFKRFLISPLFSAMIVQFGFMGLGKIIKSIFSICSCVSTGICVWIRRYLFNYLPQLLYAKFIAYFIWREGRDMVHHQHENTDPLDYYLVVRTDNEISESPFSNRYKSFSSSTSNGNDYVMDFAHVFATNVMKHVYESCINDLDNNLTPVFDGIASDTTISSELNGSVAQLYTSLVSATKQLNTQTSLPQLQSLINDIVSDAATDQNGNPVVFLSVNPEITKQMMKFISPETIKKAIKKSSAYKYDVKNYSESVSLCKMIVLPTKTDVIRLLNNCENYIDAIANLHGGSLMLFLDQNLSTLKSRQFMEYILFYVQSTVDTLMNHNDMISNITKDDILKIYDVLLCQITGLCPLIDPTNTKLLNLPLSSIFSITQNMVALFTLAQHRLFSLEKFPYSVQLPNRAPISPPPPVIQYTQYSNRLRNIIVNDDSNITFYTTLKTTVSQYASGVISHPYIKGNGLALSSYFADIEADLTTDYDRRSTIGYVLRHIFELSTPLSDSLLTVGSIAGSIKESNKKHIPDRPVIKSLFEKSPVEQSSTDNGIECNVSSVLSNGAETVPDPTTICRLLLSRESIVVPKKSPIGFVRSTTKNLIDLTKSKGNVIYHELIDETDDNVNTGFIVGEAMLNDIENDISINNQ